MRDLLKLTAALTVATGLTLSVQGQDTPSPASESQTEADAQAVEQAVDTEVADTAVEEAEAEVDLALISYIQGFQAASQLAAQFGQLGYQVDPAAYAEGATTALEGGQPKYEEAELRAAFDLLQADVTKKRDAAMAADKTRFVQSMADTSAYKTTDSGLQYLVIEPGDGPSPTDDSVVVVNYTGRLEDGTVFDSSYMRNQPAQIPVSAVVPGWQEAPKMMKPGGKWRVILPGNLAYGEEGRPQAGIGPNATLIFDIELLGELPAQGASHPSDADTQTAPASTDEMDVEYQGPAEE